MKVLKGQDVLALGFMTFALFVGAGNIIFPPIVGLQSGPHVWMAALGFLITAVGLPVITVVEDHYIEDARVCGQVLGDGERTHQQARRELGERVRDLRHQLT